MLDSGISVLTSKIEFNVVNSWVEVMWHIWAYLLWVPKRQTQFQNRIEFIEVNTWLEVKWNIWAYFLWVPQRQTQRLIF